MRNDDLRYAKQQLALAKDKDKILYALRQDGLSQSEANEVVLEAERQLLCGA